MSSTTSSTAKSISELEAKRERLKHELVNTSNAFVEAKKAEENRIKEKREQDAKRLEHQIDKLIKEHTEVARGLGTHAWYIKKQWPVKKTTPYVPRGPPRKSGMCMWCDLDPCGCNEGY